VPLRFADVQPKCASSTVATIVLHHRFEDGIPETAYGAVIFYDQQPPGCFQGVTSACRSTGWPE
jgi:hypothetical protein